MNTLAEIRDGPAAGLDFETFRRRKALVTEVQACLAGVGLLDPPADGDFGPVSLWAWRTFCARHEVDDLTRITADLARLLLATDANAMFPLRIDGTDLVTRVARSMLALGYWIARHPQCVNIAYAEGIAPDGRGNDNRIDHYNDVRLAFTVRDGRPELLGAWTATTQPGWYYTHNPVAGIVDPVKAAAQIALGQYKAWVVGEHNGSNPHEALVQRAKLRVHRDKDRNGRRDGDPVFERPDYAINQHHGSNSQTIGKYSAGCLVGNRRKDHLQFMKIVKGDRRYTASRAYKFMTAVIGVEQLLP
jgi:hypothetical protein